MQTPTVNIIIVGFGLSEVETECFHSIIQNTKHPYIITFYDNYNKKTTLTQVWNTLIKESKSEFICLINSDTVPFPNWLTRMMNTLQTVPKCKLVGPSTNCCHGPQSTIPTFEEAEKHLGATQVMTQPLSGFCILFPRSLWEEIGGFDERFKFYGAESLFGHRATKLGYTALWRQDSFVYHEGQASISTSNLDIKKERELAKKLYWEEVEKDKGK